MKKLNQLLKPYKPFCVVKHWCIWDIQSPSITEGRQGPIYIVKADYIIDDELKRFPSGGWVRTTAIKEVYENCIFRTGSSSYILVGEGTRKDVDAKDAVKFF